MEYDATRAPGPTPTAASLGGNDELGGDLATLLASVGSAVVEVRLLPGSTGAYRVVFADGRVVKGQIVGSPSCAEQVERLSRYLGFPELPPVIGRSGRALLFEWVDGEPLTTVVVTPDLLRACGAVQGRLHTVPLPPADRGRPALRVLARDAHLRRDLSLLVEAGLLAPDEAHAALDVATGFAPNAFTIGIEHGDFCAENMVLDRRGRVWAVDNETLRIDAHDHDLGRTWYRWSLRRAGREAFFEGYRRYRSTDGFFKCFPYWAITAIVEGATFRFRCRRDTVGVPLHRLRLVLRELQRGASVEGAVFCA